MLAFLGGRLKTGSSARAGLYFYRACSATPPKPKRSKNKKEAEETAPQTIDVTGLPPNFTIRAGLLLERLPLTLPDPHPAIAAYYRMKKEHTVHTALLVQMQQNKDYQEFEKQGKKEKKSKKEKEKKVKKTEQESIAEQVKEMAQKYDELRATEEPLEREARLTKADRTGDVTTQERRLDRRVYLFVKGENGEWKLPEAPWRSPEVLRKTAERSAALCGKTLKVFFYSNSPDAHLGNTFYYRAAFVDGEVKPRKLKPLEGEKEEETMLDFCWLARDELDKIIVNQEKRQKLYDILLD